LLILLLTFKSRNAYFFKRQQRNFGRQKWEKSKKICRV
jgi:hypothetical protein